MLHPTELPAQPNMLPFRGAGSIPGRLVPGWDWQGPSDTPGPARPPLGSSCPDCAGVAQSRSPGKPGVRASLGHCPASPLPPSWLRWAGETVAPGSWGSLEALSSRGSPLLSPLAPLPAPGQPLDLSQQPRGLELAGPTAPGVGGKSSPPSSAQHFGTPLGTGQSPGPGVGPCLGGAAGACSASSSLPRAPCPPLWGQLPGHPGGPRETLELGHGPGRTKAAGHGQKLVRGALVW